MKENNISEKELGIYRKQIDKIDDKIITLLNERGKFVEKIGKLKKLVKLELYQPDREREIIERLKNKSLIIRSISIEAIWREIFDACKLIQDVKVK